VLRVPYVAQTVIDVTFQLVQAPILKLSLDILFVLLFSLFLLVSLVEAEVPIMVVLGSFWTQKVFVFLFSSFHLFLAASFLLPMLLLDSFHLLKRQVELGTEIPLVTTDLFALYHFLPFF